MIKEPFEHPHPSRPGFEPENPDTAVSAEIVPESTEGSEGIVIDLEAARAARPEKRLAKLRAQREKNILAGLVPRPIPGAKPLWQPDITEMAKPDKDSSAGEIAKLGWLGLRRVLSANVPRKHKWTGSSK